jgi:hypothetical protein
LSGQKNAYFANSPNTSHRPRCALASLRKATPRPAFDGEWRKAESKKDRGNGDCGRSGWCVYGVERAEKYKENEFFVPGARACQPHLRKPDFLGLAALKSCF